MNKFSQHWHRKNYFQVFSLRLKPNSYFLCIHNKSDKSIAEKPKENCLLTQGTIFFLYTLVCQSIIAGVNTFRVGAMRNFWYIRRSYEKTKYSSKNYLLMKLILKLIFHCLSIFQLYFYFKLIEPHLPLRIH